ncbi:MAG: hypothetical protein CMO23_07045 [Thiotrichales bacterium]|nr:hypothetical protein [Thiotrichales bacterium]
MSFVMMKMMKPELVSGYIFFAFAMWAIMMIAMMVPVVIPTLIIFRQINKSGELLLDSAMFLGGYFAAWFLFALIAASGQWTLHYGGYFQAMSFSVRGSVAGLLFIFVGLYQLTPFKNACLARCQSPVSFFMNGWRDGRFGAFQMGLSHGLFCLGCCWMLMLLMFVGGVMSILTMAVLSTFLLAERLIPSQSISRFLPATALILVGIFYLA